MFVCSLARPSPLHYLLASFSFTSSPPSSYYLILILSSFTSSSSSTFCLFPCLYFLLISSSSSSSSSSPYLTFLHHLQFPLITSCLLLLPPLFSFPSPLCYFSSDPLLLSLLTSFASFFSPSPRRLLSSPPVSQRLLFCNLYISLGSTQQLRTHESVCVYVSVCVCVCVLVCVCYCVC